MTWNTESVVSGAVKRKKVLDHCHTKKRFTIKSRRPSDRHRITTPGRSRCYSITTDKRCEVDGALDTHGTQSENDVTCLSASASSVTSGWSSKNSQDKRRNAENSIESKISIPSHHCLSETMVSRSHKQNSCHTHQFQKKTHEKSKPFFSTLPSSSPSLSPPIPLSGISSICRSTDEEKDLEPEISAIKDPGYWPDETQRTRPEGIGPAVETVQLQTSPKPKNQVPHLVINPEVDQSESEGRKIIKSGSKIWRILKVRRRGSKRNGSKFTLRRTQQATSQSEVEAEVHSQEQVGNHAIQNSQPESASQEGKPATPHTQHQGFFATAQQDENLTILHGNLATQQSTPPHAHQNCDEEPIFVKDIAIEFKSHQTVEVAGIRNDSLTIRPATPSSSVTNSIRHCAETESFAYDDREQSPIVVPLPRRSRKHRTRKIQVRMHRRPRKIIVIGDMSSGKTNLISAYCRDQFTATYTPTILHCYLTDARICNESIELVVIEISGRDDFEPLRRRAYYKLDAAMICYSVDNVLCFDRISKFWVPELRKYAPKVPLVLVGTKRDLRDAARDQLEEALGSAMGEDRDSNMCAILSAEVSFNERFVSKDRGKRMAESVGADGFIECSSLYRDHTRNVFETVTKVALRKSRRRRRGDNRHLDATCAIL